MQKNKLHIIHFLSVFKKILINTYSFIGQAITTLKYGKELKLSIGVSRSMRKIGWVSLDKTGKPDIKDSAELLLTIPNASCKVIIASAILEHLNFSGHGFMRIQKAIKILKMWRTKLKKGGALYVAVPDGDFIMKGIYKHPKSYWQKNRFDYMGDLFGYMDTKFNAHSIFLNYSCMNYCLKQAGYHGIKKIKNPIVFMKEYNHSSFNKGLLNITAHA